MNFTIILSILFSTFLFDSAFAGGRLYGGRPINIKKAPYMAQVIAVKSDYSGEQCGGSIIKSNVILTAGHCVRDEKGEDYEDHYVHLGETNFLNDGKNPYPVKKAYVHPNYKGAESNYHNDVGLLELVKPIMQTDKIQIIQLATINDKPSPGSTGVVSGWGTNPDHPNDKRLFQLTMTIISSEQCYGYFIGGHSVEGFEEHEICAQDEDKNHCKGDSGGPFVDSKTGRQIGVVSYGPQPCTDNAPSVFARVTDNLDFINKTIRKIRRGIVMINGRSLLSNETSEAT